MDNRLLLSLALQGIFVAAIGGIKSLVRGRVSWARFYLGLEVALAALGNGVTNIVDIVREWDGHPGAVITETMKDRIVNTAGFVVVAAIALLFIMLIHQRWEQEEREGPRPEQRWKRGLWMGLIANGIAISLLTMFVVFRVKGKL